ncbi:MAG: four helix bundle protein [Proteobacteria bacterium]|nr:four helix bundle protein [Pseudomonadota bacterium]
MVTGHWSLENKQFCYYARGSLFETKTWLTKGNEKNLVKNNEFDSLIKEIETIGKRLNAYIKSIGSQHQ